MTLLCYDRPGSSPYDCSKIKAVLESVKVKAQTRKDIKKIIHKHAMLFVALNARISRFLYTLLLT